MALTSATRLHRSANTAQADEIFEETGSGHCTVGVGTSIIGRPLPLPGQRRADLPTSSKPLICEKPLIFAQLPLLPLWKQYARGILPQCSSQPTVHLGSGGLSGIVWRALRSPTRR